MVIAQARRAVADRALLARQRATDPTWWRRFASLGFWRDWWFWWLAAVFVTWVVMELFSLVIGYLAGEPVIQQFTLSDTIRDWSTAHRWLAPLVVGVSAMLLYHFFVEKNVEASSEAA